jgi:hypothetical protein
VLICYLDDSGKDPQNALTTVAGYIAPEAAWRAFENEVEPIFKDKNVRILHAKDLHDTDGEFHGWTVLQKQAFIARICQVMSRHITLGMTMSAVKATYKDQVGKTNQKRSLSPYTFCFNVIIDWIMTDIRLGRAAHADGVALFLEAGHENNSEAEKEFYIIRTQHKIEHALRSISFVTKGDCRAIQIADLLAFYSRRDSAAMEKAEREGKEHKPETMIKLITEIVPHRGFVATKFFDRQGTPPSTRNMPTA